MNIEKFHKVTIITAERGKFLKLKDKEDSEELIGRPVRVIFDNSKEIPELEEGEI